MVGSNQQQTFQYLSRLDLIFAIRFVKLCKIINFSIQQKLFSKKIQYVTFLF